MELIEAIYRGEKPGLGGEPITLVLTDKVMQRWKRGDHITYDHKRGTCLHVEGVFVSYLNPYAFVVCRILSTDMKTAYIEARYLAAGTDYIKVGEDSGDFSKM